MKYLLLYALLIAAISSFAQTDEPDCGWYGDKTVAERNALFPFNKAKKVVLVSYPDEVEVTARTENNSPPLSAQINILRTINFKLGEREQTYYVLQEVQLNQNAIDEFSNLIFNYTFKERPEHLNPPFLCYQPRNSILFYDEANTIICCYEVCFACDDGRIWPDPDKVSNFDVSGDCPEVFTQLKAIFRKNGITYGL